MGCWDRLHADLLRLLRKAGKLDPDMVIVDGVIRAGLRRRRADRPQPRGSPAETGTKHTLLVDRHGVPLAIRTAGANASDHTQIIPLVLDFPKVGGKPGRPKELPDELYADRGYDSDDDQVAPAVAGHRAAHRQAEDAARQRAGEGPLGGGADDQLAQGAAADAGPVRPPGRDPGRLDVTGGQCHRFPHPSS